MGLVSQDLVMEDQTFKTCTATNLSSYGQHGRAGQGRAGQGITGQVGGREWSRATRSGGAGASS